MKTNYNPQGLNWWQKVRAMVDAWQHMVGVGLY